MTTELFDDWDRAFAELCAGYDKPATNERRAAYRKSLSKMHIGAWQQLVDYCLSEKGPEKFPTTYALWNVSRELRRQRARAPEQAQDDDPPMSRWAIAANKILFAVAYGDLRRGFLPMGKELLERALVIKADFVAMGEASERDGEPMSGKEFDNLCRDGFRKLLGTRVAA